MCVQALKAAHAQVSIVSYTVRKSAKDKTGISSKDLVMLRCQRRQCDAAVGFWLQMRNKVIETSRGLTFQVRGPRLSSTLLSILGA